jgi:ABC-type amino acid transport substrate-binding protein
MEVLGETLGNRLLALLCLSLAIVAAPARAGLETLRVGVSDSLYPASYRLEDGRMGGAMARMLAQIARETGVTLAVEGYPSSRTQLMVQKGDLDAFIGVATDERKSYALFAPTAVLTAPHGIFYRAGNEALAEVTSMAQLTRFRLGGHLGDGWVKDNFPTDHIEWARTPEDLLRMVEAGRVDYMIGDAASAQSRLKGVGLEGKVVFRTLPFLVPLEYRLGLRSTYPGAEEIVARLDRAIVKVRAGSDFAVASSPYH